MTPPVDINWDLVPNRHPIGMAAMSDGELRMAFDDALEAVLSHDPGKSPYKGRCPVCGFVRAPCETASLAWDLLRALKMLEGRAP